MSELITKYDPKSPISEVFRLLRTNIQYINKDEKSTAIMLTSTTPANGKTFVTANLAITLAQANKRVILVDSDIRKPRLHKVFELENELGLSDYLSNSTDGLYIRKTNVENLSIVTAGTMVNNPSELIGQEKFKKTIEALKEKYDYVIIDSSPILMVTDSILVSRVVDATILIAIYNKTRIDDLKSAIRRINHVGGNVAGIVLNRTKVILNQYNTKYFYGNTIEVNNKSLRMKIKRFFYNRKIKKANKDLEKKQIKEEKTKAIKEIVGDEHVLLALSGGVDSSVAAVLINNAIGKQLTCMFVDTGLLRKDEGKKVLEYYKEHFNLNIVFVDAKDRFLNKLKGVDEPEAKRKIIGHEFIEVFNEEIRKLKGQEGAKFLAQGTIYPDVIESQSIKGPSHTIKSHHNVGGLPEDLKFELLEPLKELFKDEVRKVGHELGLPDTIINRHPFPGPGLGIRVIGEVTPEKVRILQEADDIFIRGLRDYKIRMDVDQARRVLAAGVPAGAPRHGEIEVSLYDQVWQAGVILLPVKSVGVMGDERTYEQAVALRAVTSTDAMTADWSHLPYDFLARVSNEIINKVRGVNRVCYDISSKPPATIEWE